jgi:hypothetical protein
VLESVPYRRLAYSWHTSTPELAESLHLTDEARERIAAEQRSKVTFEIEPLGEVVKLTVVHDGFEPGSVVASMVSQGWPGIISSLNTLLETGEILPTGPEPPGSTMTWHQFGVTIADPDQVCSNPSPTGGSRTAGTPPHPSSPSPST